MHIRELRANAPTMFQSDDEIEKGRKQTDNCKTPQHRKGLLGIFPPLLRSACAVSTTNLIYNPKQNMQIKEKGKSQVFVVQCCYSRRSATSTECRNRDVPKVVHASSQTQNPPHFASYSYASGKKWCHESGSPVKLCSRRRPAMLIRTVPVIATHVDAAAEK